MRGTLLTPPLRMPHCRPARRAAPARSIWTIDLAHLLARHGLPVSFTTVTIGINASYGNESFYMEHIEEDERRVGRLFSEAPQAGEHACLPACGAAGLRAWPRCTPELWAAEVNREYCPALH